jgi:anaerobic selenocysteine-containing dehydrogenase
MDCPDTCALQVTVEDGRVTALSAGAGHPNTAGFICSKVAQFDKRLYHEDRLLYPQRRTGKKGTGEFERISWDEAIAEITEKFKAIQSRSGGEAILPFHYDGSNGYQSAEFLDDLFFARLGAARLQKTVCAAVTGAVTADMYGKMPGVPFEDFPLAKCIIIWGANPKASNIHLVPYLKEAKRNGAFIAVVDPRRNFSDAEVDLHLPVLPGADLPLALALVHEWKRNGKLDKKFLAESTVGGQTLLEAADNWSPAKAATACGVPEQDIQLLAEKYAALSPAVVRCGWGPERNSNGGQAIAAILAMPALLGKFGVRGGQ